MELNMGPLAPWQQLDTQQTVQSPIYKGLFGAAAALLKSRGYLHAISTNIDFLNHSAQQVYTH